MRDASVADGRPPHWEHDRYGRFQRPRAGSAAVRFAAPLEGTTSFVDGVRGEVSVDNASIGDRVLVRADETPVYQLAVLVDDLDMGITHVIRGVDLLLSTPLQINLALALGRTELPLFAHVPLIDGSDGKKLSTRHDPVALEDYLEIGVLPEALINYMGLLGWFFPDGREVFTLDDMQAAFDLDGIGAWSPCSTHASSSISTASGSGGCPLATWLHAPIPMPGRPR